MGGFPEDLTVDDLVYFKYTPITSSNVERSLTHYKYYILSDNQ